VLDDGTHDGRACKSYWLAPVKAWVSVGITAPAPII